MVSFRSPFPFFALLLLACSVEPPRTTSQTQSAALDTSLCVTLQRGRNGAVADTLIKSNNPKTNFGSLPMLSVSAADEALLRFDLSSIPAWARVDSATLRLQRLGGGPNATCEVHRALAPWSEGTVSYGSFGQSFSSELSATIDGQQAPVSVDLTRLTGLWVAGVQPNDGMVLTVKRDLRQALLRKPSSPLAMFISSESSNVRLRPALDVCYTLVDHCAANPCLNGGTCTESGFGHSCQCAAGFTGADCETNIDDCAPNPCLNGGVCTDGVASYSCQCPPGYLGPTCATPACPPGQLDCGGACRDPLTDPNACGGCGNTCAPGESCTQGHCQSPWCAPAPAGFPGVYRGTADVSVYWTMPLGNDLPPSCSEYSSFTTTTATLDISGPPYAVSFTVGAAIPNALKLDTTYGGAQAWTLSNAGFSLTHQFPCIGNLWWESPRPATIFYDPANQAVTFRPHCQSAHADSCSFSINQQTDWEMTLPLSCVKNQTVYIAGNAVTCDSNGNITSSVPCDAGQVVGPCAAPTPDFCPAANLCTDLLVDGNNCGTCGNVCSAAQQCQQGSCVTLCTLADTTACAQPPGSVRCANLSSSNFDCGVCDRFCLPLESCSAGQCVGCNGATPDRCSAGYGKPTFCTDLMTDRANCGFCYHACPAGKGCDAGVCGS